MRPQGDHALLAEQSHGECHERNGVHRTSGRIFKITYGNPKAVPAPDFAKMDVSELVKELRAALG